MNQPDIFSNSVIHGFSPITAHDVYLFREGTHTRIHEKLGAQTVNVHGVNCVHFAVWAPNAERVSVVGDFNGWNPRTSPLKAREDSSGIWEGVVPSAGPGSRYKFHVESKYHVFKADKADPYATAAEVPPSSASIVSSARYAWKDQDWMRSRREKNSLKSPISVYELHLGSWMRVPEDGNRPLTYRELAPKLAEYVRDMGFTHVEFMPVMEHPFYGSWGYQTTGYFAATARYGTPQDLMYLIDTLHQNGIGVILDIVPSHFPTDGFAIGYFDGTHLYEHADPKKGFHPDWKSFIFNYGRNEVRSFLLSFAISWLDRYHADGLRVDAVASMLYLDYSRNEGDWIPNAYGGRENLEAISLIKDLNAAVYREFPDVQTVAEESTDWPMVSRPAYVGGLGFGMKWNMGWMHDTLKYFSTDPVFRKYHHDKLTFSIWYAFTENFMLPLSHDEVVHGKGSLLGKMPGDEWQKFANLRLLYGFMYCHPGKKLLFMGSEFGQVREWTHEESLEWHVLQYDRHAGVKRFVRDLNAVYRALGPLHQKDFDHAGFEWIDFHDWENSVLSFLRRGDDPEDPILCCFNFTPVPREQYIVGVPYGGRWTEVLNSDSNLYGGSNTGNAGGVNAEHVPALGRPYSIKITLPPLAAVIFKRER